MFDADKGTAAQLNGSELHIGLVQARFNEGITNTLAAACRAELIKLGVQEAHIHHVLVPGALALGFGWLAFRSRIKGVYFSIMTQALTFAAMLLFFRN